MELNVKNFVSLNKGSVIAYYSFYFENIEVEFNGTTLYKT